MADDSILCPNCGKAYRWRAKIAGRRVRCVCQQKFRVPDTAGGAVEPDGPAPGVPIRVAPAGDRPKPPAPEPDPYELDEPDDTTPPPTTASGAGGGGGGKCPSCNSPLRPGAVICLNCGFNVAEGAKIQTTVQRAAVGDEEDPSGDPASDSGLDGDERTNRVVTRSKLEEELAADMAQRHRFQENILPLILIGVGAALLLLNTLVLAPKVGGRWDVINAGDVRVGALVGSLALFLIQLPCLFAGILIISTLFGSAFGELFSTLKKLCALALVGGQFDVMLDLLFGLWLGPGAFIAILFKISFSLGVFWLLAKLLFDELEPAETAALWLATLLLPGFVLSGILLLF